MAHSAVLSSQFLVVFGGRRFDGDTVPSDLYILSLDGNLGKIAHSQDLGEEQKPLSLPEVQILEKQPSSASLKGVPPKAPKTLKITNNSDRKIMSGHILNQIINFSQPQTN